MSNTTSNGMEEKQQVQEHDPKLGIEVEDRSSASLEDSVDCFHGFITEKEVECRLRKCKIDGALILRAEQNSVKPKFCLSWLSPTNNAVTHFSIDRVCDEYFLFGRSFTTLSGLIQAFINESKTAVLPLQPPSPVKLVNRQRIAVLPFRAMPDTDEISFCEGDMLTEIQRVDNEWVWARLEKNGISGLVPVQLTVPLNDKNVKPEELPYFYSEPMSVLTQRLAQCGVGCYLLRHSIVQSNLYTLMVNTGTRIEKFQIKQTEDGDFEIGGRIFATIPDIIERYSEKEICRGFHLMRAVLTNAPNEDLSRKNTNRKVQSLVTNSFCPETVLAYRKCKGDKWKRCYVTLSDSNGSQLYVIDYDKKAKPKVALDLGFCFVYKIPEGSFDRANCLLVTFNGLDIYPSVHLSFQNEGTYLHWLNELRLRCFGCRYSPSPFAVIPAAPDYFIRSTTVIYLTLTSFRGGSFKPDTSYSAVIAINGIFLTKTELVLPIKNTIIFNKCFLLQYIPPGPCSLKFILCSHNPSTKTRCVVFRDHLQKDLSPLYVLADDGKELCVGNNFEGFVFRAVRHRIVLLPEEQYASFFVLLTTRSFILSTWVGSVLDTFNRKCFTRLLLSVLLPNYDLLMSFVEVIMREQIKRETEVTLFRRDSFCTCCISTVLRMTGKDLVMEELADLLTEGPPKQEFEIVNALKNLFDHLPFLFRAILSQIIKTTKACFNDSKHIARRVASVFFILRFVNPILTLNCSGSTESCRQLPKTIQSLANQASSVDYSPEKSTHGVRLMADLLDATALSFAEVETSENPFCGYSKIDQLALLAFQVEQVLEQQDSDSCPLPEAYTVISLLKKHAEKYLSC